MANPVSNDTNRVSDTGSQETGKRHKPSLLVLLPVVLDRKDGIVDEDLLHRHADPQIVALDVQRRRLEVLLWTVWPITTIKSDERQARLQSSNSATKVILGLNLLLKTIA